MYTIFFDYYIFKTDTSQLFPERKNV